MSCAFDLDHYRELLEAARAGGYRFAFFDHDPGPGDLLLRHDVDLSLAAALDLATAEHEAGAAATYFLMTESVFYNLGSQEGEDALARLRELGHRVGLHAVYPRAELDDRFDPVIAWHNPDPEYMNAPVEGAANVMEPRFFSPETYRSDSNQQWRHGCPHEELAAGRFEWLQLLTHPEIWVHPGDTMGETMLAMLDAERERRLRQLEADRIDLIVRALTLMVTASGAPGTAALLRALRENGERAVRLVGTDMSSQAVGRHLCDTFHVVPAGSDPSFGPAMAEMAEREGVDAVLPQSSFDLLGLAEAKELFEAAVLVASPEAIRRSNDKADSYAMLDAIGVRGPAWRRVRGGEAVAAAARELGYPDVDVALKPVFSSGSRGFRILSSSADRREQLLTNRPGVAEALRLEDLLELLGDDDTELLVMELATGKERTIDGFAEGGRDRAGPSEDARGDARRARHVLRDTRRPRADGDRGEDRRRARARPLLQHPARRRARDRDQPADLDHRLPGGSEPPLPRRQARAWRALGRGGRRRACTHPPDATRS